MPKVATIFRPLYVASMLFAALFSANAPAQSPSAKDYENLQAAIDALPGKMIFVPDGEYHLSKELRIQTNGTGLYGFGTIIQEDPARPVLLVEKAADVRLRDLTFTRAAGKQDATEPGIRFVQCRNLSLEGLRIKDCKSREPALRLDECRDVAIRHCEITNYKRIAVDDRTNDPIHWGYAFHAIDGTGMLLSLCKNVQAEGNRIVEYALLPTREMKDQFHLGELTEGLKPSVQGSLAASAFKNKYVNNWHQGSAVLVSKCDNVTLSGNYLENCAQGFDVHSDHVIVANNTILCGMIGIKLTHGARNVVATGNMLRRIDLWGILLNPATASHYAKDAAEGEAAVEANVDGGTVVSDNIVTEFGFGNEYWNWGGKEGTAGKGSYAIALFEGQEDIEPPLRDVVIGGNIVYNVGRDRIIQDGKAVEEAPRYRYAVYAGRWGESAESSPTTPRDIVFGANILHPGTAGVSNIDLATIAPTTKPSGPPQ